MKADSSVIKSRVAMRHQECLRLLVEATNVIEDRCNRYLEDPAGFDEKKYPFRGKKETVADVLEKCADVRVKIILLERQAKK